MTTDISRFTAQYNGQTVNFSFDDMTIHGILIHGHFGTMKLRNGDEQDLTCILVQKYQLREIVGVTADGGKVYPTSLTESMTPKSDAIMDSYLGEFEGYKVRDILSPGFTFNSRRLDIYNRYCAELAKGGDNA